MEIINKENFKDKTQAFCIVKFGAEWCTPCRVARNVLKQVETELSLPFYEVDTDTDRELRAPFVGKRIPIVVLYKNNQPLYTFDQVLNKSEYIALIKAHRGPNEDKPEAIPG